MLAAHQGWSLPVHWEFLEDTTWEYVGFCAFKWHRQKTIWYPKNFIWSPKTPIDTPRHLLIPRAPIDPPPSCINSPRPCSSCNSYPNQVIFISLESKKSGLQDDVIYFSICWHLFVQMSYTSFNHKFSWFFLFLIGTNCIRWPTICKEVKVILDVPKSIKIHNVHYLFS